MDERGYTCVAFVLMDFGEVLDTSFGRLRIQLSAVFFIISRVLAIFSRLALHIVCSEADALLYQK